MSNPFLDIIIELSEKGWSPTCWCMPCKGMFIEKIKSLAGHNIDNLVSELENLDFDEMRSYNDWYNCIPDVYRLIQTPEQGDKILRAWLPKIENHLREVLSIGV